MFHWAETEELLNPALLGGKKKRLQNHTLGVNWYRFSSVVLPETIARGCNLGYTHLDKAMAIISRDWQLNVCILKNLWCLSDHKVAVNMAVSSLTYRAPQSGPTFSFQSKEKHCWLQWLTTRPHIAREHLINQQNSHLPTHSIYYATYAVNEQNRRLKVKFIKGKIQQNLMSMESKHPTYCVFIIGLDFQI